MKCLKRLIACFLAVNNLPLSIVDGWTFQQRLLFFKPNLKIPGRHGIRSVIINEYMAERERLATFFKSNSDMKVSFYVTNSVHFKLLTCKIRSA